MKLFVITLAALAALLLGMAAEAAGNPRAPNLALYAYQRIFTPDKPAVIKLSAYNLRSVAVAVYRTDIEALAPNAAAIQRGEDSKDPRSVAARLKAMALSGPVRTFRVTVKDVYPNRWSSSQAVKLPKLPAGVYVVEARGGGVVKRTWAAISSRALLVKRSPDSLSVWLVDATAGQPAAGVPVALYDQRARAAAATTGRDGLATFKAPADSGLAWVATRAGDPAFAMVGSPGREPPFAFYLTTDRPVYRPGQLVRFRGTIRKVSRGAYSLPKEGSVRVQIKARGDTVVYDEKLSLNEWGSFADDFQLAPEPPLGEYSLEAAIGGERGYAGFAVEAYRKPEFEVKVKMPADHQLGGGEVKVAISADYYFGSPVSGGKVRYRVNFSRMGSAVPTRILTAAGLGSAAIGRMEENFAGQGVLDAKGKMELTIPTRRPPFDRSLSVRAEVTDLSLRSREGEDSMTLAAAQFRLSLGPEKSQYQPGDTVKVNVWAHDYSGNMVAADTRVSMIESLTDREGRSYTKETKRQVTTRTDAPAVVSFTVARPGRYRLEMWARDTEGNPAYAESGFSVTKEKTAPPWPTLETRFDKDAYKAGNVAGLRVRTSLVGAWALLTIEGERLYRQRVVRIMAKEFTMKIQAEAAYQPGVRVYLTIIKGGQRRSASAFLNIPAEDKRLTVLLAPDKSAYEPGETAIYDLTVRDQRGAGVPAELGLAVIDAALYAIRRDDTPDPYDFFWRPQACRVETGYSHVAVYPGGGYQHIAQGDAVSVAAARGLPPPPRVRRTFVDTAFWSPSVVTGGDGRGRITFTVPDNLTTWRATARGLSKATQAGTGQVDVKVSLPLLVRLTLPRFYVRNDEGAAAAIVHNYTKEEKQVRVTLTAEGAQLLSPAEQTITLPAEGIQRLTWKLKATGMRGSADDEARFLVSADGGAGARDAMESTLPVLPDGVRRVEAAAGMGEGSASVDMALPEDAVPGSASLELALSPSLAGPVFEALDYLVEYPHGCAEQTMSRFLPNILVARALKELGADRPEPKMLQRFVSFGLQKLLRYQHDDGGWHWWEFDDSDPYVTAYVVYGLAMARDAGYPLAAGPLPRGINYLRGVLAKEEDRAARAYLLWAMAYANEWDKESAETALLAALELYREHGKLDIFSQASLALALQRMSELKGAPAGLPRMAKALADDLEGKAVVSGTAAHWTANAGGGGSWLDSDVEVTAHALQALLAIKPESEHIVPAVRWLMAARQGKAWNSSKDTASAVLALTAYLKRARELAPEETVVVWVGDRAVQTAKLGKAEVFGDPVRVAVSAADLKPGTNTIRLEKTGPGNLYWSAHLTYVIPAEKTVPLARGIQLKRTYRVMAEDPVTAGAQQTGSMIEVTVDIIAEQNYRYAVLEEPIPAGCEIIAGDEPESRRERYGEGYPRFVYDHREQWDDRLVYYFDYLRKGTQQITYFLRAETPGAYRIRPGTASLMYFPEVRGEGKLVRLSVVEE